MVKSFPVFFFLLYFSDKSLGVIRCELPFFYLLHVLIKSILQIFFKTDLLIYIYYFKLSEVFPEC